MYVRKLDFFGYRVVGMGSATCGDVAMTITSHEGKLISWGGERRGFKSPYTQFLLDAGVAAGFEGESFLPLRKGREFVREVLGDLVASVDEYTRPHLATESARAAEAVAREQRKVKLYNRIMLPDGGKDLYEFEPVVDWAAAIAATVAELVAAAETEAAQ